MEFLGKANGNGQTENQYLASPYLSPACFRTVPFSSVKNLPPNVEL